MAGASGVGYIVTPSLVPVCASDGCRRPTDGVGCEADEPPAGMWLGPAAPNQTSPVPSTATPKFDTV